VEPAGGRQHHAQLVGHCILLGLKHAALWQKGLQRALALLHLHGVMQAVMQQRGGPLQPITVARVQGRAVVQAASQQRLRQLQHHVQRPVLQQLGAADEGAQATAEAPSHLHHAGVLAEVMPQHCAQVAVGLRHWDEQACHLQCWLLGLVLEVCQAERAEEGRAAGAGWALAA
jgi:hypothetical protein